MIGRNDDGLLSFCYTNRVCSYSLQNAEQVENVKTPRPGELPAEGEDIANMHGPADPSSEEVCANAVSPDGNFEAICYQDGKTEVRYQSGKILHNLEYGKGVLKTAAISKDGNRAVTLSANTYGGKRRLQMWDLDDRQRIWERFCDGATETVHLTDHGEWIIGSGNGRSWIWNWADPRRKYHRGERFISETERGLTTYGSSLLIQSGDGALQALDLEDQSLRCMGKFEGIQYATILPNGTAAVVDHSGRYVQFKSTRTKKTLRLNSEKSPIRNVHAFKTQPFMAVVTANGRVSMYHTGTGQRTRILTASVGHRIVAFHPQQNVLSFSDGNRQLATF